jgi:hypothetical protein
MKTLTMKMFQLTFTKYMLNKISGTFYHTIVFALLFVFLVEAICGVYLFLLWHHKKCRRELILQQLHVMII